MTAFTTLALTGACDQCGADAVLYLRERDREYDEKEAVQRVREWLKYGHFCPGKEEGL